MKKLYCYEKNRIIENNFGLYGKLEPAVEKLSGRRSWFCTEVKNRPFAEKRSFILVEFEM